MGLSLEREQIQHELEKALESLAESKGDGLVRQIRPILLANLERGRVERFLEGSLDRMPAYVAWVAEEFSALHGYLHQLQHERSAEVWTPLYERMQTWAYNFFLRKGFSAGMQTQEIAGECASEAAVNLLHAYFPYDNDFDAWAHIIVQNACRKYIERAFKKSAVPDGQIVDLDDNLVGANDLLTGELGEELVNALAQLTKARREVIQHLYLDELPAEEVARKLGKSVGAIYSLQFHALEDLRKILGRNTDKFNE